MELNELIVEKDHEMRWKERARWIKFEEDVEEDTDRWGKPHVASLSFRSLLELRRTITHGKKLQCIFGYIFSKQKYISLKIFLLINILPGITR